MTKPARLPSEDFQFRIVTAVLATGSYVRVVPNDTTRWAIIISGIPASTDNLQAFPGQPTATPIGIQFGATWGNLILNFRDHGTIVQSEWWLLRSVAGSVATITEVLYRPIGIGGGPTGLPEETVQP